MPKIVAYKNEYHGCFVYINDEDKGKTSLVRLDGERPMPSVYGKICITGREIDDNGKPTRRRWQIELVNDGEFASDGILPPWMSWRCPCCDNPKYEDDENCICAPDCPNA